MMILLYSQAEAILESVLLPVFICVVLPCVIVWITTNAKKHELDKRAELAMRAIENGAEIDPMILSDAKANKRKGVKEKVFSYLKSGIILTTLGLFFLILGFLMKDLVKDAVAAFYSTAAIFILLGGVFFLIYVLAKNKFTKEIAKEEAEAGLAE